MALLFVPYKRRGDGGGGHELLSDFEAKLLIH